MIFYPSRRNSAPMRRHSSPRPLSTDAGDATHLTWMLKSFVMGITLLGLSYWLVQIAGVQYLASLTSATLLGCLLAYVVWCMLHKNRLSRQSSNSPSRLEGGNNNSTLAATTETLTPTPPPPFDHHQAYKFNTPLPPRDSSPPPTYEEAVRAMLAMAAPTNPNYPMAQLYATPPSSITPSTMSALTPSPTSPQSVTLSASALPQQASSNINSHLGLGQSSVVSHSQHSLSVSMPPPHHTSRSSLTQSQQSLTALAPTMQQNAQQPRAALTRSQQSLSALTTTPQTALMQSQSSLTSLSQQHPSQQQIYQNALRESHQSTADFGKIQQQYPHQQVSPQSLNESGHSVSPISSTQISQSSEQSIDPSELSSWSNEHQQMLQSDLTTAQKTGSTLMPTSSQQVNQTGLKLQSTSDLTPQQISPSALSQVQQSSSALTQTLPPLALNAKESSTTASALNKMSSTALSLQQSSVKPVLENQAEGSLTMSTIPTSSASIPVSQMTQVITPPPRFQSTSRPRQQTPPPPPPKPPSVYDIGDVS